MTNDQDVDLRDHEGDVKEGEGDGEKNVIEGKGDGYVDDDEDIDDAVSPPPDLLSTAPNCQNPTFLSSQECS